MPLGRLTYVAYLFHWGYVTKLHLYHTRKPYYYTIPEQIMRYLSVLTYVFMASFIICLLVETPFLNLEKLLVNSPKKSIDKVPFCNEFDLMSITIAPLLGSNMQTIAVPQEKIASQMPMTRI